MGQKIPARVPSVGTGNLPAVGGHRDTSFLERRSGRGQHRALPRTGRRCSSGNRGSGRQHRQPLSGGQGGRVLAGSKGTGAEDGVLALWQELTTRGPGRGSPFFSWICTRDL